jgi:hypothetical protein
VSNNIEEDMPTSRDNKVAITKNQQSKPVFEEASRRD